MNVVVFSKPDCPWCDKVKDFLAENRIQFKELNAVAHKDVLVAFECKTVPQVFVNGRLIGGFEDTVRHLRGKPE